MSFGKTSFFFANSNPKIFNNNKIQKNIEKYKKLILMRLKNIKKKITGSDAEPGLVKNQ